MTDQGLANLAKVAENFNKAVGEGFTNLGRAINAAMKPSRAQLQRQAVMAQAATAELRKINAQPIPPLPSPRIVTMKRTVTIKFVREERTSLLCFACGRAPHSLGSVLCTKCRYSL